MVNEHPEFISRQVSEGDYYFFDLDPNRTDPFQVICGGWERCLPHYRVDREGFPYFSLELVVAGTGTAVLGGRRFRLVPGTVFHYGPGVRHHIASDADTPLEKYFVDFVGGGAAEILKHVPFSDREPLYLAASGPPLKIFEELQARGKSRSIHAERICSVLTELLLLQIAETAVPVGQEGSAAWNSFDRCRRYIEDHFDTLRTLDEVSAGCSLDKPYLCRLFKRFGRETPYAMLMRLKMDHAAGLLLHSNLMIKEVAQAVGFSDPYHFSRTFKRVRGLAPTEYIDLARRGPISRVALRSSRNGSPVKPEDWRQQ